VATFRLVDEDGSLLGELTDAEAIWGAGDTITFKGQGLKVLYPDLLATDQTLPVLVVKVVDVPE
jgi:hypothetical protein